MIELCNITKFYPSSLGRQYILKDISFKIPEGNIAILGVNGAGKSTLFRLIAGSEYPNSGRIKSKKFISWPVALASGIHSQMTGRENTRFIGRVNGVENLELYEKRVKEFAELSHKYDLPVKTYSSGMRARLAFACCVAIDFDVYLVDEAFSVGDQLFREKARFSLMKRGDEANLIMVSHNEKEIRSFCDSVITLHNGQLKYYRDLDEGLSAYRKQR